jgi:anti-sigma factor RsiW
MRCSSCEPLLDAHLEGLLRRRRALQVAEHLHGCTACASLLGELRVIDGLLTTARAPGSVTGDFTAGVLSAARTAPTRSARRFGFLIPLFVYLAAAWTVTAIVALKSDNLLGSLQTFAAAQARDLAALGVAARALAPATPVAAAAVTLVLLLDLFLLFAVFYGYRRVRPLLALYLRRGSRP